MIYINKLLNILIIFFTHSYDIVAKFQIKIDGIVKSAGTNAFSRYINDLNSIKSMLQFLECEVTVLNIHRLGKFNPNKHRGISVALEDSFAVNYVLSHSNWLHNFNIKHVYINKFLESSKAKKRKILMKERYQLITEEGIGRQEISFRNGDFVV